MLPLDLKREILVKNTPSAVDWPIASCVLGLATTTRSGLSALEAGTEFWTRQLKGIADEGFTYIELNDGWIQPARLSSVERGEFLTVLASLGLELPSIHVQRRSIIEPGREKENLAYHHESIEAAAELGATVYSTGLHQPLTAAQRASLWFWTAPGPVDPLDDPSRWDFAVGAVRELGRHAAQVGLAMSMEIYEDTFLGSADSAVNFITDVDLPSVGLNPDIGNLVRLHRPIENWRDAYAKTLPYANYWHLKNYTRDEVVTEDFFTSAPSTLRGGVINYREVIDIAVSVGYRGVLTCEQYGGDSVGVCGENSRYLRGLLVSALGE
jgi:sugar phosphate isomerase/epimerase